MDEDFMEITDASRVEISVRFKIINKYGAIVSHDECIALTAPVEKGLDFERLKQDFFRINQITI